MYPVSEGKCIYFPDGHCHSNRSRSWYGTEVSVTRVAEKKSWPLVRPLYYYMYLVQKMQQF